MALQNKKELGQNWLYNREILEEIAELTKSGVNFGGSDGGFDKNRSASEVAENRGEAAEVCVEIGPGLGTLTTSLLRRFSKVIAVEFDAKLAKNLPKSFPGKNLEVINADILKFDFSTISEKYVIAGNIPYYITSPILEKVLNLANPPERIVLLLQKEVAERIASEKESLLSLRVKNRAEVFLGRKVSKEEFTPAPKVDSRILVLEPRKNEQGKMMQEVGEKALNLAKIGFSNPRKKLVHNLAGFDGRTETKWREILEKNGISENARPGDLKLEDWQKIIEL